ncbi:MAG: Gfo/Idh/MocA family oxidoreductase [Saprospiraceae bacterium]|nr:Gfo/Idh/MocA family oxidoreductase [Saprospiraceae bacterium]
MKQTIDRRDFIATTGMAAAVTLLAHPITAAISNAPFAKKRLAMVGTGIRGTGFWGKTVLDNYNDIVEFVGLCDINPGRVEYGKKFIGANCPTFTDFEQMMKTVKPDILIVTTMDSTHDQFIIKGLQMGVDVITEKPMTTDEVKCQKILDAERKSGRKVLVGFNYRYGLQFTKIKELLAQERAGKLTSVDFHWYLNTYHGADYFRRWHAFKNKGGSLLVHKATHHFDLLNWWIDSDPVEVFAYGKLEHYGKNNSFRHTHCRPCPHKNQCKFYWDMTKDKHLMALYADNEQHDGYLRDGCVWRENIDIYDKMAVQIRYANDVQVSYSLTTYSPYEGWRIAFNGMSGRLDSWEGIPFQQGKFDAASQAERHAKEMEQNAKEESDAYDEIIAMDNFGEYESYKIPQVRSGHGGGDKILQDRIFRNPDAPDPLRHAAGTRDGAMSVLIGIAARNSIESGKPVKIKDLTDLKPSVKRL